MSQPKSSSLSSPLATIRPQSVTALQITEMYHLLGTALCNANIPSDLMRQVLDDFGDLFAADFVSLVNNRIEIITGFHLLRVKVNRAQTAYEAINAIQGRSKTIEISSEILEAAPKNECVATQRIHFFTVGREATSDEVQQKYEKLGLRPVDVWEICAFNTKHPNFANKNPNTVHFQDVNGRWWYVAFGDTDDGFPFVAVAYVMNLWDKDWWFMGLPIEPEE